MYLLSHKLYKKKSLFLAKNELFLLGKYKTREAICQKLNIEIMAEDRINVLNSLQETCDIVCFENMYNMGLNDKIPNFKTFYEMDGYIREIEKKKNILQKTKKLL